MVSSMNTGEVNQKLSEVLQENMKLKETLKQSNLAMKQQFSTLLLWQEEVLKVHQNHKKKFSETKEFINCLKKENAELKIKLSKKEPEIAEHDFQVYIKKILCYVYSFNIIIFFIENQSNF